MNLIYIIFFLVSVIIVDLSFSQKASYYYLLLVLLGVLLYKAENISEFVKNIGGAK